MRKVLYIFGLLTDADVEWIGRTGVRRHVKDKEIVIREGAPVQWLIFLLEGEFLVSAQGVGEIARLGVGEIVGEMSMLDSAPPSATSSTTGTRWLSKVLRTSSVSRRRTKSSANGNAT